MKALIFELWGDYAQFRKYYTNMSPLTYTVPPRTVLCGIIGALIGSDKEQNPEVFSGSHSFFALQVVTEPDRFKIPTNYIKTEKSPRQFSRFQDHKCTLIEYLQYPRYKVYFSHRDDDIYNQVKDNLMNHKTHYTLSLGICGCLANFSYLDEVELIKKDSEDWADINSIVMQMNILKIDWTTAEKVYKTQMPRMMKNNREVSSYQDYLYDITGHSIKMIVKERFETTSNNDVICEM